MNEIDILSQSDKTYDLPDGLKEKLDFNTDIDFISSEIGPINRRNIAAFMGLEIEQDITLTETDVENSKNVLLMKLINLQSAILDEIAEERSEEVDMTLLDKTDCSLLHLRKSESSNEYFFNLKYNSDQYDEEAPLCRARTKSSMEGLIEEPQTSNEYFSSGKLRNSKVTKNMIAFRNSDGLGSPDSNMFKQLDNLDNTSDRTKDLGSPVKPPGEDIGYIAAMERFKKKKKPNKVTNIHQDIGLNEIELSDIRRVSYLEKSKNDFKDSKAVNRNELSSKVSIIQKNKVKTPDFFQKLNPTKAPLSIYLTKIHSRFRSNDRLDSHSVGKSKNNEYNLVPKLNINIKESKQDYSRLSACPLSQRLLGPVFSKHKDSKPRRSDKKLKNCTAYGALSALNLKISKANRSLTLCSPVQANITKHSIIESENGLVSNRCDSNLSVQPNITFEIFSKLSEISNSKITTFKPDVNWNDDENVNMINIHDNDKAETYMLIKAYTNNKNKKLSQNKTQCSETIKLPKVERKLELSLNCDEKMGVLIKPQNEFMKPRANVTRVIKRFSQHHNKSNLIERKKSEFHLTVKEENKTLNSERLGTQLSVFREKITLSKSTLAIKNFEHRRPFLKVGKQSKLLTQGKLFSDYIKLNKKDLENKNDASYFIQKNKSSNSKTFAKAMSLPKREF